MKSKVEHKLNSSFIEWKSFMSTLLYTFYTNTPNADAKLKMVNQRNK